MVESNTKDDKKNPGATGFYIIFFSLCVVGIVIFIYRKKVAEFLMSPPNQREGGHTRERLNHAKVDINVQDYSELNNTYYSGTN